MKVFLVIDGEPVGKERPRMNSITKRTYTPNKTRDYEELIKWLYQSKVKHYFEGYIKMTLRCYYSIAKSNSKKVKEQKINNVLRPSKKPDIDNVVKIIADSLNEIAYKDDTQIVEVVASKYYSDKPRVEVELEDII
ncbi:TPA: RusA family crossover junction endodeoxyribonuclease [Clostridioides difficile]|uniref:RusA family crossover junction endodeoxyribonuclease n=1 Tax=Clostridioides difficile TaxID=1496 RepID=UPI00093A184F|nr:RusA family crossover junction endodeoxyribonuclease [Clostridioides difficile]EGT3757647.1 RusA family crossover junction endodeoxyribonuclease [Clostridioides difficile]EGT4160743.1 RusA family crossover junction endodeoxyribonuclease [Clostridioides difficile]EGT4635057.1 RusA family crossover junction endodeoxyribonuclease [Clostridioides difficile]EGT4831783.1 RusA family crossover junction endodeoxyribonuclease [Clostridioides difficile]EII6777308.1 RusA family crossover junction endo